MGTIIALFLAAFATFSPITLDNASTKTSTTYTPTDYSVVNDDLGMVVNDDLGM